MNHLRLCAPAPIFASLLVLSACGGGGVSLGARDSMSIPPIEGMSWEQTHKLNVGEGDERAFDFVNYVDANENGRNDNQGGFIQFIGGYLGDDNQVYEAKVANVFDLEGGHRTRTDMRYHRDFLDETRGQRILVAEIDTDGIEANGHEYLLAIEQVEMSDGWSTENYIYLPAEGDDKGYVGLAALAGPSSSTSDARLGLFGDRTLRSELLPLTRTASYEGVGRAYVGSQDWTIESREYVGPVSATVDFADDVRGGQFTSGGTLTSSNDPTRHMNYSISGRIGANGQLAATRATVGESRRVAASVRDIGGAMFGPEANSMGYVYTLDATDVGDLGGNFRMTGGAVLDR